MPRLPLLQTFFKPEAFLGLPLLVSLEGVRALHPSLPCARPCVGIVSYGAERERGD
jgi:hypothetical protein